MTKMIKNRYFLMFKKTQIEMNKSAKAKIKLKDIKHKKGIYYKEQQAIDIATLMLQGFTHTQAYNLIQARYK